MASTDKFGLYVHVPFCRKKCPYCHFAITPYQERKVFPYISAICKEYSLKGLSPPFSTLYFGGGTPSTLSPKELSTLISLLGSSAREITLEVNPEDVNPEYVQAIAQLGINRVSMGVQSLDDHQLQLIERRHSAQRAKDALLTLYDNGIQNLSIDLMYDLPHQTLPSFRRTLLQISDLPITHISLYNLVLEPGSLYEKQRTKIEPQLPSETLSSKMLALAVQTLEAQGFLRYEISAFCKLGYESQHNRGYWTGKPFVGLGPSAWSYQNGIRSQNIPQYGPYVKALNTGKDPTQYSEQLEPEAQQRELLAVGLRLCEGINKTQYTYSPTVQDILNTLEADNFLTQSQNHIQLTDHGRLFYDTVASELML